MEIPLIHIDPAEYSIYLTLEYACWGPYHWQNAIYILLRPNMYGTSTYRMFKSTDWGQTWVRQDEENEPTNGNKETTHSRGTGIIHVGFGDPYGNLSYVTFSMVTDTWGSVVSTSGISSYSGIGAREDSSVVLICTIGTGVYYIKYDGAWSPFVLLSDDIVGPLGVPVDFVTPDPLDVLHVIYRDQNVFPRAFHYRQLSTTDVLSTPQNFATFSSGSPKFGQAGFLDTTMCIAYWGDTTSGTQKLMAHVAIPYTDSAPTWTREAVNNTEPVTFADCTMHNNKLWAYWIAQNVYGSPPWDRVSRAYRIGAETWSNAELIHDEIEYPTFPGQFDQFLHSITVASLPGGRIGVGVGAERDEICTAFYIPIGQNYRYLQYRKPMPYGVGRR